MSMQSGIIGAPGWARPTRLTDLAREPDSTKRLEMSEAQERQQLRVDVHAVASAGLIPDGEVIAARFIKESPQGSAPMAADTPTDNAAVPASSNVSATTATHIGLAVLMAKPEKSHEPETGEDLSGRAKASVTSASKP